LRFKTELVSCSQLVFEFVATFRCEQMHPWINTLLLDAQFRSYLCTIHYLPKEHSIATLAFASLLSAASKAPEELQKALRFFFIIVSKGTDIEMNLIELVAM